MSVVVGIIRKGKVYMAADSLSSSEDGDKRLRADKKIYRNKGYLIGFTGSPRAGQILSPRYWTPPTSIYDFPDAIREHYKEKGCMICTEGSDAAGVNLMVGHKGNIYEILIDFQLVELIEPYSAVGAGKCHALGALHMAHEYGLFETEKPEKILEYAVRAAEYFCSSVGGSVQHFKI